VSKIFYSSGSRKQSTGRPDNIQTYITKAWNGGTVWFEDKFRNILFAKDSDIYLLESIIYLVVGGAYSVDKFFRNTSG